MWHVSMLAELVILNQCTKQDLLITFKLYGLSQPYQLDKSISSLRAIGWYFIIKILIEHYVCKQ